MCESKQCLTPLFVSSVSDLWSKSFYFTEPFECKGTTEGSAGDQNSPCSWPHAVYLNGSSSLSVHAIQVRWQWCTSGLWVLTGAKLFFSFIPDSGTGLSLELCPRKHKALCNLCRSNSWSCWKTLEVVAGYEILQQELSSKWYSQYWPLSLAEIMKQWKLSFTFVYM